MSNNNFLADNNGSFAVFGGPANTIGPKYAGHFLVDTYKTDKGYFVVIECVNNEGHNADFAVTMLATGNGCAQNFISTLASHPANHRVEKPTYKQLEAERDALAAENANLKSDIRQRELIHVGFTNEHQVTYVTEQKEDGAFYPDSDNECYIPLYMLNIHSHRVGPDSEIYKEHCERWRFRKEVAAIRAEAIEASLDAIGAPATSFVNKRDDFTAGFNFCAALLQIQADKVRQGGE